ncbi:hypothetical protein D5282_05935 [bacterium 1xD8-48]|nr:hypothetical protein [bacterium 1xD8-48]
MRNIVKKNEMVEGIIWNYGSLVILSVSGFLFNCIIIYFYDAAALGVFNRTYAWYCVLSQITVWGVHMSVMKLTSEYKKDCAERGKILLSALIGILFFSVICVIGIEIILSFVVRNNRNLLVSMQLAMPGLIFFSLNKILLNYLNGLSEMKAYAIFQSLRYIIIVVTIFIIGKMKYASVWLSFCFIEAEIIVFLAAIYYLTHKKLFEKRFTLKYIKQHIRFGTRILPANMVVELNTKVDIICLGVVLGDDFLIGIYSFAILFVEGFYQLYVTVRRSINPKITDYYVNNNLRDGIEKINMNLKKYFKLFSPIALLLITIGYCIVCNILNQREYIAGVKYLIIICVAIAVNGRKIVFGNIFSQTGFPMYESAVNVITVIVNFFFNLILIYFMGLSGAAIATAISHVIYGFTIHHFAAKKLNIII